MQEIAYMGLILGISNFWKIHKTRIFALFVANASILKKDFNILISKRRQRSILTLIYFAFIDNNINEPKTNYFHDLRKGYLNVY